MILLCKTASFCAMDKRSYYTFRNETMLLIFLLIQIYLFFLLYSSSGVDYHGQCFPCPSTILKNDDDEALFPFIFSREFKNHVDVNFPTTISPQ